MPLVAYPSVNIGRHPDDAADTILTLPVERTELILETPSRSVHENQATRDVVVVNRGPAFWNLTLTIGSIETETDLHREFEQWLARMHDLRNYANIPLGTRASRLHIKNLPANVDARSVQSITGNTLTLDYALNYVVDPADQPITNPDNPGSPVPVGTYVRVDNQVAMLDSIDDSGRSITTTPLLGSVGAFVAVASTMRCRLSGGGEYRVTSSNGMTDPITIPFTEHRR